MYPWYRFSQITKIFLITQFGKYPASQLHARNRIFTSMYSLSVTFHQVCRTPSVIVEPHANYHLSTSPSGLFPIIDYILLKPPQVSVVLYHFKECTIQKKTLHLLHAYDWRDSTVDIATTYGLDDRGVVVRGPVGSRIFCFPCRPDRL